MAGTGFDKEGLQVLIDQRRCRWDIVIRQAKKAEESGPDG